MPKSLLSNFQRKGFIYAFYRRLGLLCATMVVRALKDYRNSNEYTYYRHRQEEIDELLANTLLEDQKDLVGDILFELGIAAERETDVVYRQGLRDGATILKALGVLV